MSSIDVLVPCYEYGDYLAESVNSILTQPVENIRVLIIDNASTDSSVEVAQELRARDSRVEFIARKRNLGYHESYNDGIDWAKADYFMILDADDYVSSGALARSLDILDRYTDTVFCHGVEQRAIGRSPRDIDGEVRQQCAWTVYPGLDFIAGLCGKGFNYVGNTTVVRRTLAQKEVGHYDPSLRYADDMNMWLRLATLGSVAETSATQGIRRIHCGQETEFYRQNPVHDLAAHLDNFQSFFMTEGARIPNSRQQHRRMVNRIAYSAVYVGAKHLARGRIATSGKCMRFAVETLMLSLQPPSRVEWS